MGLIFGYYAGLSRCSLGLQIKLTSLRLLLPPPFSLSLSFLENPNPRFSLYPLSTSARFLEAMAEPTPPAAAQAATAEAAAEGGGGDEVEDVAVEKAHKLINRILETQTNPNPKLIHSLATLLEVHGARYWKESNYLPNNGRGTDTMGKLANMIRDNDDFYELLFSKFLSENRYAVSVSSAAARLLIICSSGWPFPHVFEDAVLDNIKRWVMDDAATSGAKNESNWMHLGKDKPTDAELLRTYSVGLLAIALNSGGPVVEDILTLGVSAKLMHFLRVRVLGEASSSQKDKSTLPAGVSVRAKDEGRGKSRVGDPVSDKGSIPRLFGDANGDLLRSELTDSSPELVGAYDISEENSNSLEVLEGKGQLADDNSLRIRKGKNRGKGKAGEGILGNERTLMSPGSNRGSRDRSMGKGEEVNKRNFDSKRTSDCVDLNGGPIFGQNNDERLRDCVIGSKDISEIVLKAIEAAESEAREAGAPHEAVKAAGDAAAELVKSAALEVWNNKNDEDAALEAANNAASTVIDAAMSTDVSRSDQSNNIMPDEPKPEDTSEDAALEDFSILDREPLNQLHEIYCIQCLEILGEYVEALGPILQEKGVDVCLALLQRTMKDDETVTLLLPELLKLINALGAHKKFSALFVDRGGIQKLLEVRRSPLTFVGLSLCLFTIGSLQGIMERVSALSPDVVNRVVELALQLLECQQDQARKNSAIFFASAFVFRAILDSFDSKDGLQKFLNILQSAASVRSGAGGGNATPNPNPEVLTTSEKQIAYHTCVALRQYFRAHLLLLVDSLRPNKGTRSAARSGSGARVAYKPLDISNEAIDAVSVQIQRDRKLGTNLVRARWAVVDRFLALNGHSTVLELCQAPPVERYLHDLAQYAFGILHIVTFVPCTRKLIVNAQLSNNRVGMAIILDAANAVGFVDPEVIRPALNVLINLVCPPPSISNKPLTIPSGNNAPPVSLPTLDKTSTSNPSNANTAASAPAPTSAVVGDRRITLGSGAGCAGLAAQLEQGYRQAREAVRTNNGIKVLLNLLNSRMIMPPGTVESIRALACRVLLGLAIDDTIAHILTKLQVGKKLSELIRDSTGQPSGGDQGRWQKELTNVAIELIAILTNSGKATTLAATDAAAPALRRIERAAIAAATPISYHSRELLQLIHEHLQASGLKSTADTLLKEADIAPLPSSGSGLGPPPPLHQTSLKEPLPLPMQWPSSRTNCGFLHDASKSVTPDDDITLKRSDSSLKRKPLVFSSNAKPNAGVKLSEPVFATTHDSGADMESQHKSPIVLPMKRKFNELKDSLSATPTVAKRIATGDLASYQSPLCQTPGPSRRPTDGFSIVSPTSLTLPGRANFNSIPVDNLDDVNYTPGMPGIPTTSTASSSHLVPASTDQQLGNSERMTLDSLVVQYLKHQHRQCPAPITTLPPLSLLQPHVCPEPSRALGAPTNVTSRMAAREIKKQFSTAQCPRRDRQFIYSRFRPCRTCRDDVTLLTCLTFLGDSSRIATGNHSGELKIFDCNTGNMLEAYSAHQTHVTLLQSVDQLLLSSTVFEVRLWDAYAMSGGPLHSFDRCKAARFSHSGAHFAALSVEQAQREVLLYDVQTCNLELRLQDNGLGSRAGGLSGKTAPSLIHFSPCDDMLLWNGVLWDRRSASAVHRFDQFTDYGGGGFHPSGNEVILNSEVWDLRKFKLLRSVPSLDQTVITFNGAGDVIYAILRRNLEETSSAINTRRVRHPLFPAFRTIDSSNYSEIATVQVDRCVLDLAVDPADSLVGVVAMDDHEEMFSSARLYDVGRRRAADDDSDPDDGGETEEEESDDEESDTDHVNAMLDLAAAGEDSDDVLSASDNDDMDDELDSDSENDDGEFNDVDDLDLEAAQDLFGMMADDGEGDDEDDDSDGVSYSSGDELDL
ncbi:DDB1-and CUL4-associated factor 1 [Rhynchospora pubera]|uniref:DDB1-and CUL4-associated factor 1 n=1 Tax=Rhynchospora pubera TaxID=906938 RepID=A0AAV8ELA8_9POAL|nr:DDB1-and CUL4-associated factor 1 [Rhynchospora pubera]